MITRRALFLRTVELSAAGALIAAIPLGLSQAIADTLSVARDDYDIAAALAKEVIKANDIFWTSIGRPTPGDRRRPVGQPPRPIAYREENRPLVMPIREKAEVLIGFLVDKFPPNNTPEERKAVTALFEGKGLQSKIWDNHPRTVFGAVFAIGVVKELIAFHWTPLDLRVSRNFDRFSDMMGPLIRA